MLGYLILVLLQIGFGFYGEQQIRNLLPPDIGGLPLLFLRGAILGGICWATGLVASFILKGVSTPSAATAANSVIGGLLGALAVLVLPALEVNLPRGFSPDVLMMAGAILGYLVRR